MATFESAMSVGERVYSAAQWLVQRLINKKKLADRIVVEVVPWSSALQIDCIGNSVQAYVRVYNFNPLELKVQHCVIRLNHAGFSIKLSPDRLPKIPAFGYHDIFVTDNLTPEQAKSAATRSTHANDPNLECNLTFDTRLGSVEVFTAIQHIPYEKINAQVHQLKVAS